MGARSKHRIGRFHKQWEKKRQSQKKNKPGRPKKMKPDHDNHDKIDNLCELQSAVGESLNGWTDMSTKEYARYVKLTEQPSSHQPLSITHCITIIPDLTWKVWVHSHEVNKVECAPIQNISDHLNSKTAAVKLMVALNTTNVCAGHPDLHLCSFIEAKHNKLTCKNGNVVAYLDTTCCVTLNGETYQQTIRTASCQLLVHGVKCAACVEYRSSLRALHNRWMKRKNWSPSTHIAPGSHTALCRLTTPERKENSFQRLFWEQQLQATQAKCCTQVRWHPLIVWWCLHLKLLSSAAYHSLRSTGFIKLPSERTLRDYTHWIQSGTGVQQEVTQQLLHEIAKIDMPKEVKQHIVVVCDEVRVKDGIVYDKHSWQVIGFTNLGDINSHLLAFERSLSTDQLEPSVAKYVLVFMVRGLIIPLEFPYTQYPTTGITADLLFPVAWEVVRHLECAGLQVHALTCDKASPNRKFFRMHKFESVNGITYRVDNPYSVNKRYIYFFSDVPHLIKTVRNAWSNSFAHSNVRPLWVSTCILCINIYI